MTDTAALHATLARWQRVASIVAIVALALCGVSVFTNLTQFLRSYLLGFFFWWAVSMGCLGILMLYYLVGGRWGTAARPIVESGSSVIPLTAVLFIPVALGVEQIYPWVQEGSITEQKALYLNLPFFYGRAMGYFVIWLVLSLVLGRRPTASPTRSRWRRLFSAGGLVLLILTVTFAGIDRAMSLDPTWFSSIYGALVAIGGALAAMALVTLTMAGMQFGQPAGERVIKPPVLADLSTLMFAFLMLWTYFSFSQFLIIWAGNLPEENTWYLVRLHNGWQWLAWAIVLFQFVIPFFLLLSREVKLSPRALAAVALLIFVMQFWYTLWTISPSFHPEGIVIHWADVVVPVAIGGLWISCLLWRIRRRSADLIETSTP